MNQDTLDLIRSSAASALVDPSLVQAIVQTESAGNTWVLRYESKFRYLVNPQEHAQRLGLTIETETQCQMISWGLMQIMGAIARELKFMDPMPKLCDPQVNIFYGCKKLKELTDRWGQDENRIIASFNSGSPRKTPDGIFVNQAYVDRVSAQLKAIRG